MTREERVTLEATRRLAPVALDVGGAVVMRYPEAPDIPMLNRVVGLGVARPATEDDVDAVLEALGTGTSFYVAVAPEAEPEELPRWLEARGLEPGWGWMSFRRGIDVPETRPSPLRLEEVRTPEQTAAFARIVRIGFGLPETLDPALARAPEAGWRCWLALDGDEPVSTAGMLVSEGAAYLSFAATLSEHRGKGAQSLLLAERIRVAGELGCDVVTTETGELRDDRPSSSYRNLLRAGFEEVAVTANWLGRR
ncbi:MAG TPA: GNAT family N-acetyltransferase [Gaiellaceae bacterium]|nr:GNAT family N-acetyltransferase [Gaiellaceae bacterium]